MSQLTLEIADQVVAVCRENAAALAKTVSTALDVELELALGEPQTLDGTALPDELEGPALATILTFGEVGAIVLLPAASGLIPAWCESPDRAGESKLATLAEEFGSLLMPDQFVADRFSTARVETAHDALSSGGVADQVVMVPFLATCGEKSGKLSLIWPLSRPESALSGASRPAKCVASSASR